jgi:hypothetical protein
MVFKAVHHIESRSVKNEATPDESSKSIVWAVGEEESLGGVSEIPPSAYLP